MTIGFWQRPSDFGKRSFEHNNRFLSILRNVKSVGSTECD